MRSRRRRLQRQRKNNNERFRPAIQQYPYAQAFGLIASQQARVWGRPRGCFEFGKGRAT